MTASEPVRVLIVEDEYFLAAELKRSLGSAGMEVVGPVAVEADALPLLHGASIDCAILDINLRGEMVYPLARKLRELGVPFLFVSGYDTPAAGTGFDDVQLIQKPFDPQSVIAAIARLVGGADERAPKLQNI